MINWPGKKKIEKNSSTTDISAFVDPRKDHHDFVAFTEKTIKEINEGTKTIDDIILNLSYTKFARLAMISKSELSNVLSANPTNADNIKTCFSAFANMTKEEFMKRKKELTTINEHTTKTLEEKKQRKNKTKEGQEISDLEEQLKKLKDEGDKDAAKFEELQKKLDILLQKGDELDAEETKEEDDIIAIKQKIKEIILTFYNDPDFTQAYGSKLCEDIRHKMDEEGIDSKKHNSIMVDILGKEIQKKDKLTKTGEIIVKPEEKTVKTAEDTSGDTEKKENKKTFFGGFGKIFSRKTKADGGDKTPKEIKPTREEKNRAKEQQKRQEKIDEVINKIMEKIDGDNTFIIDFHIEKLREIVGDKQEFLRIGNQLNKKNFWLSIMKQTLPRLNLTEQELMGIGRENEDNEIRQEVKTKLHISQVELDVLKEKYNSGNI